LNGGVESQGKRGGASAAAYDDSPAATDRYPADHSPPKAPERDA
jgi:hypothetical protein